MSADLVIHSRIRVYCVDRWGVATQRAMNDFTLVLPELAAIGSGDLKVYDALDQLCRMVERYCSCRATVFRDQKLVCRYQSMGGPEPDPISLEALVLWAEFLTKS